MNFVVTLIQILFAAVLHISTIKTASINKEDQKTVKGDKNVVVSFMQVFNKSRCQTREVLVDIYKEYPDRIEHTYIPACVILKRCSGCCNDEAMECVPTRTRNVTMEVLQVREKVSQHLSQLSFVEHEECDCRQKPEVKIKKEKGKGQKRKRKKQRDTAGIAEAYASSTGCLGQSMVSLLMVGLLSKELFC
ncbi:vascular endothelial growth factor A-A isoform X2 [Gadus morhua]|uniref:Platelet-derived growth factor (PDGF) family profile domain-containing protein n=3 Tax=Gadus TaxID=8048 RepID=A0A8C5AVZ7_GADMO|nr:vascular endothelial growth factor A-A-like isoform X2 [Gadus morhua]XP_030226682.1 vascular endothelial growth factor A-A-like isoform X2 [Gadus morhua]XP_056458501.1 vascular endothelial growth factor A-A isoform X3 [Gadus chalcogrammus]XP_056458502.1 vascular endothelial growth factor A-A isoform X3 [Gadus chalcogrammus]XP_056458503.1 vascular endothelial growth factor A-A isoform X3 [Gadus chalcogrammus]XP_059921160.1 vascular endothelial growth factor A-A-like isoform X3 [Gadus macroce